nr:L592 [uncultured bacterium]
MPLHQPLGDVRFARLATISNGHLNNLRAATTYPRVRGP